MLLTTEEVYAAFGERLKSYIARRVADPADAEDLLQEIFIKIHRRLDGLRNNQLLAPWLYQIARRSITDYYRAIRPGLELPDDLALEEQEESEAEAELARGLEQMLDCLPEKYRQAVRLADLEGIKQEQVAARLGLSLSGAKSRVQRGRELLRRCLLECCEIEFDRRGRITAYTPRRHCGPDC